MERNGKGDKLANGLAWFSIGVGLGELLAPSAMARLIGVKDEGAARKVLRTHGMRGITAGIGILSQPTSAAWMWSRVAGDVMDLAALGVALNSDDSNKTRLAVVAAAVAGVTALDVFCGQCLTSSSDEGEPKRIVTSIGINRPPGELYRFWKDATNLRKFMEWDGEVVEDRPEKSISWRGNAATGFDHTAAISFERAPGDRGSIVKLEIEATGGIASLVSKVTGAGLKIAAENILRRFKQVIETGEVMRSDASIHTVMHAAQPPVDYREPAMAY